MKKIAISVAMVSVLAACGGGGDAGPSPVSERPSVALTAANYEVAGKEVLGGSSNAGTLADFSGFLTGTQVSAGMTFPQFVQKKYPIALQAIKQPAYLSGVEVSESEACSGGGSVRYSGSVRDEYNPSSGDVITITANNCREDGAVLNGAMTMRISSVNGNIDSYPFSLTIDASTNDFRASAGAATYQSSGSMTMSVANASFSSGELSINIPSMVSSVSSGGKTDTFQYANYKMVMSVRASTVSMTMNGGLTVPSLGGNSVTIQTLQPFASTTGYPTSGVAAATTASGGKMRFTASSGSRVLIELDAANDGVYEVSKLVSWNEVL